MKICHFVNIIHLVVLRCKNIFYHFYILFNEHSINEIYFVIKNNEIKNKFYDIE
jgi:hypothetical protein